MVTVNTQPGGFGAGLAGGLAKGAATGAAIQGAGATQKLTAQRQEETQRANQLSQANTNLQKLAQALGNLRTTSVEGGAASPALSKSLVSQFERTFNNIQVLQGRQPKPGAGAAQAQALLTAPTQAEVSERTQREAAAKVQGTAAGGAAVAEQVGETAATTARTTAQGLEGASPQAQQLGGARITPRSAVGGIAQDVESGLIPDRLGQRATRAALTRGQPEAAIAAAATGATPKAVAAQGAALGDITSSISRVNSTIAAFKKTKAAGGILGTVIENVGGLLGQIPGIGESAAAAIGTKEVSDARTEARLTTASLLSTITGEESGRFTDTERRIAEEALKALSVTASAEQIQGALKLTLGLLNDSRNRDLDSFLLRSDGDLSSPEGRGAFDKVLRSNGFSQQESVDAIADMITRSQ